MHTIFYGQDFAHIDAYTFKSLEHFISMEINELLENRCVIIEWGELFEDVLNNFDAKFVKIKITKENDKRFIFIENNDIEIE